MAHSFRYRFNHRRGPRARARLQSAVRLRCRLRRPNVPPRSMPRVVIKPDETVVIRIARSEMGQGTMTGLAQLVAELSTKTGQRSRPNSQRRARTWHASACEGAISRPAAAAAFAIRTNMFARAARAARMMLIQAAANTWNVPAAECTAVTGVITHKASNRTVTYGKVAEAAGKLDVPKDVALKDPKTWTIAGKPLKRLDTSRQDCRQDGLRHRHPSAGR